MTPKIAYICASSPLIVGHIHATFQLVEKKFGIFGFPTQVCQGRTTAE